jgi:hypothetical protein
MFLWYALCIQNPKTVQFPQKEDMSMNEMTLEDLKRLKKYAGYTNAMIA